MITVLEKSLESLFNDDPNILKANLKEECINHQLAVHLKNKIESTSAYKDMGYYVDIEYDRNTEAANLKCPNGKNIRPDIIIHKRDSVSNNNLCVLEVKKNYCTQHDMGKIKNLITSSLDYEFGFAVSLILKNTSHCNVDVFYKKKRTRKIFSKKEKKFTPYNKVKESF